MEALFIFIAKSSALLILFYCAYYFLLRKETFFNSSRWFLLAGLITSIVLPFLVYTKVIFVEPAPVQNWTTTVKNVNPSQLYVSQTVENQSFEINWNLIILAIYAVGLLALIIKFAMDFYSLNSVLKGKEVQQQADFKFIDINENIAPFSYFDYIVYNSSMFTAAELENILEHEKVHSDQNHTVDVLISRVFCLLFWFNPIIWLYKKAILQNLEFIADSEAAKKISDKKAYQYTLLKITTHESCVAITNHFYQSLIKKRIVMLNKNQSKKRNYIKYFAVIPALVIFVLLFQIETIAQEKERKQEQEVAQKEDSVYVLKFHKNSSDKELTQIAEKAKKEHNIDVQVSNVKRNDQNELTSITVEIQKGTGQDQTIQVEGDEPIKSCGIVITTQNNGKKKIDIVTDGGIDEPMVIGNRIVESNGANAPIVRTVPMTPPTPPTPPTFPGGPMPAAPPVDMSKMPKPPVAPANKKDKVAMAKFEKELADFEKKMEDFEPDMSAFEKQVEEIMAKRETIFEKEMEKYEVAMEKFSADMDKYSNEVLDKYGKDSKEYEKSAKIYEQEMRQHELEMKQHEKKMKLHEKELKKLEKESKKS